MNHLCLLKQMFEMFGLVATVADDPGAVQAKGRSYNFNSG